MKLIAVSLSALFVLTASTVFAADTVREITIQTEKVGESIHWKPDTIEVTPGEKIKLTAKHEVEGGFDFHGVFIPELKISETVNRNKPTVIEKTIPKTLKPGDYKVGCQFHPKHVPGKLIVKKAEENK